MPIGDHVIAEYITGVQTPGVNEPPLRGVVTVEAEPAPGPITVLGRRATF